MIDGNDICLVITGTIFPVKDVYQLKLTDSEERKKQYIDSIKFFIEKSTIKKIIFCDNSGIGIGDELSIIAESKSKEFEQLYFKGDDEKVKKFGKGFGEGEIMEYVFSHSHLIKSVDYILKITGRLTIRNINWLLRFCSINTNYFDKQNPNYVDTRFYMMKKKEFKDNLMNSYFNVRDREGYYLEHAYRDVLINKNISFSDFPISIAIEGVGGSNGVVYHKSFIRLLAGTIKKWGRKFFV